jgi:uncharacterized protein (TIGR03437 family)
MAGAARSRGYAGILAWSCKSFDAETDLGRALTQLSGVTPRFTAASTVNTASGVTGGPFATDSWISIFGENLAPQEAAGGSPLPASLGGVRIEVTDSRGTTRAAKIGFASPQQINFVAPGETISGPGQITAARSDGGSTTIHVIFEDVAPGLFAARGDGRGAPAGLMTRLCGTNRTEQTLANCSSGGCQPVPIDLPEGCLTVLTLYGTGIRRAGTAAVEVTIGGRPGRVLFAGEQGQFEGLDQVNVEIPTLIAAGIAEIVLTAAGKRANPLQIAIGATRA